MTEKEIIELTARVRELQRKYFRTKNREVLQLSKKLDKELDEELAKYLSKDSDEHKYTQMEMF